MVITLQAFTVPALKNIAKIGEQFYVEPILQWGPKILRKSGLLLLMKANLDNSAIYFPDLKMKLYVNLEYSHHIQWNAQSGKYALRHDLYFQ